MTFTFLSSPSTLPPLFVLDVQNDNKNAEVKKWMLGLQVGTRTWGPAQSYFGCVPTVLKVRIRLVKSQRILWAACMKENGARLYNAKHV
jgi:hypothetical protein